MARTWWCRPPRCAPSGASARTAAVSARPCCRTRRYSLPGGCRTAGHSVRYNSRIVVRHQIQATRLTPAWLLSRLYWQGVSTVLTRRLLGRSGDVWRELPRRVAVAVLFAPTALLPGTVRGWSPAAGGWPMRSASSAAHSARHPAWRRPCRGSEPACSSTVGRVTRGTSVTS